MTNPNFNIDNHSLEHEITAAEAAASFPIRVQQDLALLHLDALNEMGSDIALISGVTKSVLREYDLIESLTVEQAAKAAETDGDFEKAEIIRATARQFGDPGKRTIYRPTMFGLEVFAECERIAPPIEALPQKTRVGLERAIRSLREAPQEE
jgi:hypothetical protein